MPLLVDSVGIDILLETGSLVSIRPDTKDIVIPSEEEAVRLNPLDFEGRLDDFRRRPRRVGEEVVLHHGQLRFEGHHKRLILL